MHDVVILFGDVKIRSAGISGMHRRRNRAMKSMLQNGRINHASTFRVKDALCWLCQGFGEILNTLQSASRVTLYVSYYAPVVLPRVSYSGNSLIPTLPRKIQMNFRWSGISSKFIAFIMLTEIALPIILPSCPQKHFLIKVVICL